MGCHERQLIGAAETEITGGVPADNGDVFACDLEGDDSVTLESFFRLEARLDDHEATWSDPLPFVAGGLLGDIFDVSVPVGNCLVGCRASFYKGDCSLDNLLFHIVPLYGSWLRCRDGNNNYNINYNKKIYLMILTQCFDGIFASGAQSGV